MLKTLKSLLLVCLYKRLNTRRNSQNNAKNHTFISLKHLCALLILMSFVSAAGNIEHVNIGRIAVNDQSTNSQQKAGKLALKQVFIKLSGNIDVVNENEISKAIDNYEQFLIASSFIQQGQNLVFEASFNQAKVQSLLVASGRNVWASLRPSAVIWLAIENSENQKNIVYRSSFNDMAQNIDSKAFARGVEVVIPLGDLNDAMNVSVYDVWNQFISKLQDQSVRYNTDYLISATVEQISESLATEKIPRDATHKLDYVITSADFRRPKSVETGRVFGRSEEAVVIELVDIYANVLAEQFTLNTQSETGSQSIRAAISGIDSLADYVNMLALIKSVPSVKNIKLIKQKNDIALVEIDQKTSIAQLKSILLLDKRLSLDTTFQQAEISFRWQGE